MIENIFLSREFKISDNFFSCLFFVAFVFLAYYHYKRIDLYKCGFKLPGPFTLPIIGNAYLFMSLTPKDIQPMLMKIILKHGKIMKFWLGPELNISITEPKYVEKILSSTSIIQKGPSYKYIQNYLGPGLLSSGGPIWKHQRKSIFPYFNQKLLENNIESFNNHSKNLVVNLNKFANGKTFNIFHEIADYINFAVTETLLGVEPDEELKKYGEFMHQIEKIYGLIFLRMTKWWYQFDILFNNSKYFKQHLEVSELIYKFFAFVKSKKYSPENNFRPVAVDALVNKNSSLEEFTWNALTLQTASEESAATILSFLLMVCGIRKDIQQKIHEELDNIFGNSDRFVTKDDLIDLVYLDLAIKETMRLYPIGSLLTRYLEKDFKLTDDLTLPAGATVTLPVYIIHHHPDLWKDPENFIPERFLPEETSKRHPCCYLPFGYGPMNCVGQKYAIWLMKITAATILRNFYIDCQYKHLNEVELMTDISIRPVKGYLISLLPRNNN